MSNISFSNINQINKQFYSFANKTLKTKNINYNYSISQLYKLEKSYRLIDSTPEFLTKAMELAETCFSRGLKDFTGIIYSFLIKIPNLPFEVKENIITNGIMLSRKQKDKVHELARVVDLKILYKQTKNVSKKKYIKTLFEEENLLEVLIKNYDSCGKKYKTVSREMNTIDTYKFRLATAKVDIAKAFYRTNKKISLQKLEEALVMFKNLRKTKEIDFIYKMIKGLEV